MNRDSIKHDHQGDKQTGHEKRASGDDENSAVSTVEKSRLLEGYERHENEGKEKAAYKAKDVGIIVDPG